MLKPKALQSGFSILEFLIAAVILAQLLASIFSLETNVFHRLNQAKRKHQEALLARDWPGQELALHCSQSSTPGKEVISCQKQDAQTSKTLHFSALGE